MELTRRGLISLVALAALAACKSEGGGSGWKKTEGAGSAVVGPGSAGAPGSAVVPDTGSAAPGPGAAITRPFLYRVEKDGKTSHLIGTWHLGVDAEKQMPRTVWDALATAKSFAMEVDPADPAGLTAFKRHDGLTLEKELGPEYWAKLEALIGTDDAGKRLLDGLRDMKPFAAAVIVQVKDLPQTPAMDLVFAAKARDVKAEIAFLEPAQVQIRALERWMDLRMLKVMIDDYDTYQKKLQEAMVAYLAGDEAALATATFDREGMKEAGFTDSELDAAEKQMLFDRNESWIKTLEELFAKGDAFVAVGAGHLIGARSVVELLQAKGYTVTRVGA
jgi:uncharacterized protein YbaP (TraB family)